MAAGLIQYLMKYLKQISNLNTNNTKSDRFRWHPGLLHILSTGIVVTT